MKINKRKIQYASVSTVFIALFVVVILLFNALASFLTNIFSLKLDLTASGEYSLDEQTVDILKELEKCGGEGIIAYGRNSAPENVNSYRIGSDLDVKIHGVLSRITDRQGFYSTSATKKLIEKIKDYNPDIIHLHNIHGYYLNVALLFDFLKEYNKPIVWTLHDCWAFTGHCAYFSFNGCEKWETECYSCPLKKDYPTSLVMDNSKKNYKQKKELFTKPENITFVTPSSWLKELTQKSFLGK